MPWAKLHTDILGDPKLLRAARLGMKGLEFLPWLIAFAKQADDNGRLSVGGEPADARDISHLVPGSSPKTIGNCLVSLEKIGVLTRDSSDFLCFSAWEARSGAKPSDSASAISERVARHRARKSLKNNNGGNDDNALQSVSGNATEKRRGEKEVEGEENSALHPAAPRANGKPRTAPPDWAVRIADRWISRVGNITAGSVQRELGSSVAIHGEEAILAALDAYSEARMRAGKDRKLGWFAEDITQWVKRADDAEVPIVEDGWFSKAGEKATRP